LQKRTTKRASGDAAGGEPGAGKRLRTYRQKRDPARTVEPFSAERGSSAAPTRSGRFVVHLHAARRTHYDLRLEVGGALESFAVPKGPTLDPEPKRLAVRTEPHPIDYLDFEDVIPEGNYGAGPMIAWDAGRVRYLEAPAEQGLEKGKLDFELWGQKLRGRFALVQTGKRPGAADERQWLLLKKHDVFATPGREIIDEEPQSVLSGLTVEELARRDDVARELERAAARCGAPAGAVELSGFQPMLCATDGAELFDPERIYELKLDGVRIVAARRGDEVTLQYRNGRSARENYPEVARALRALAPSRVVLDGEIVAFDAEGRPSFQRLASRIHATRPRDVARARAEVPVTYLVFDLLELGDRDLRALPLSERKRLLAQVVKGKGSVRALDHLEGDGQPLFELCQREHLEGVVAKRRDAPYRSGPTRSGDWVKIKCERDDEFVVVGWVSGKGSRERLGAIDLATYAGDRLVLRGKAGSGLNDAAIDQLLERLARIEVPEAMFEGELPREAGTRRFARPELVASVRYVGWTDDGRLRFPVFRGLRDDVAPRACTAAPPEERLERAVDEIADGDEPAPAPAPTRVLITNRNKVFWPAEGYTKGDLLDYYAAASRVILPFLKNRPVALVRYPDGIEGKHFYQWNAPVGTPSWVRTLRITDDEERKEKNVFMIDDLDSLVFVANLGCIPIHVLACREHSLALCDFLTIDFDIGDQPFRHAVTLALALRELLEELGLVGYPKTSGQSGLHVLVPLGPGVGFDVAKLLVELLGRLLELRHHEIATMERRVSKRGPRVYIDTGQTGPTRTIVAPYSVRAHVGATVSTPLDWDEVHLALDPSRFTMQSVVERIADHGDPMHSFFAATPDVAEAVARLGERLGR
jgi:bifunctional non-homologous end joining protein LigD